MELPPGYVCSKGEALPSNPICRLHKSIYGLRQGSRQWFCKFFEALRLEWFRQSQSDHSLFTRSSGASFILLLVYMDDIVIATNNDREVLDLKGALSRKFKMKDLGSLRYFLGLEVARSSKGISVNQRKYALELVGETGQLGCQPASIPMNLSHKLSESEGELLEDPTIYMRLIGKLIYLTITRPDLSYCVNKLSQYLASPRGPHMHDAIQIL